MPRDTAAIRAASTPRELSFWRSDPWLSAKVPVAVTSRRSEHAGPCGRHVDVPDGREWR